MWNLLLFIAIPLLVQLVSALKNVTTHPILEPVSDEGWGNGLDRRSQADNLRLLDNDHFVWNSASDSGDNIFVNMTMSTGEEELIISMERFASVLSDVNCSEDMMLIFKSNVSYSNAVASWDWVNFNEKRTFIMIANYPGCGAAKSRQPWVISNAAYDPANLVVHLNATEKTWNEVAHTYSLDFGRYSPPASNNRRQLNADPVFAIDLNQGRSDSLPTGLDNITLQYAVRTRGQIVVDGHIESSWFHITVFSLTARPIGLQANLKLGLKLALDKGISWKPYPWVILSIPIGGFSIPDLITIGPALDVDLGVALSAGKSFATISQTINAVIPDWSMAQVSLGDTKSARFSGWEPQFEVDPPKVDLTISASAEAYALASLGIGIEILGQGIDLTLAFRVPDFTVTATTVFGTMCAGQQVQAGVNLKTTVGANLRLKAASHVDGVLTVFLDKPLFSTTTSIPRASTCIPII